MVGTTKRFKPSTGTCRSKEYLCRGPDGNLFSDFFFKSLQVFKNLKIYYIFIVVLVNGTNADTSCEHE